MIFWRLSDLFFYLSSLYTAADWRQDAVSHVLRIQKTDHEVTVTAVFRPVRAVTRDAYNTISVGIAPSQSFD